MRIQYIVLKRRTRRIRLEVIKVILNPNTTEKTSTLMDKLMGFGKFQGSFHVGSLCDRLQCTNELHLNGTKGWAKWMWEEERWKGKRNIESKTPSIYSMKYNILFIQCNLTKRRLQNSKLKILRCHMIRLWWNEMSNILQQFSNRMIADFRSPYNCIKSLIEAINR